MSVGVETVEEQRNKLKHLPLDSVRIPQKTLRGVNKNTDKYKQLVDSIVKDGVINAIAVREVKDADSGDTFYEIVEGGHRYAASIDAGKKTIPAQIIKVDEDERIALSIIGNYQKQDTKPAEYATALKYYLRTHRTQNVDDIANRLSVSPELIKKRLRLADLPDNIKVLVDSGKINVSNAHALTHFCKLAPDEINDYVTQASTMTPAQFAPMVDARIKQIREDKRKGKDPSKGKEFVPFAHMQNRGPIEKLYADGAGSDQIDVLLTNQGATDARTGAIAALAWVLHLDKASLEEAKNAFDNRKIKQEADRKARADEKRKQQELMEETDEVTV